MFADSPLENKNKYMPKCLQLNETFDFDSINKKKKAINIYDIILPEILEKLDILDSDNEITKEDYNILKTGNNIYKV